MFTHASRLWPIQIVIQLGHGDAFGSVEIRESENHAVGHWRLRHRIDHSCQDQESLRDLSISLNNVAEVAQEQARREQLATAHPTVAAFQERLAAIRDLLGKQAK
jgi:hypothetical protein